ncbi:MAG: methyltransferase domain-containing protein [Algicola sp.]|nr:methyltransferase domain-containing protein [Algicola sp.]
MSQQNLIDGDKLLKQGQFQAALTEYEKELTLMSSSLPGWRGKALCHANLGQWMEALEGCLNVLGYGNNQVQDADMFIRILDSSRLTSHISLIEDALIIALQSTLLEGKAIDLLTRQFITKHNQVLESQPTKYDSSVERFITDDTLCKLIERSCIVHYPLEKLLLLGRREVLQRGAAGQNIQIFRPFLSALACQSLLNDGLYFTTNAEQAILDTLVSSNSTDNIDVNTLLLQLCYAPFEQTMTLWQQHKPALEAAKLSQLTTDLAFYDEVVSATHLGEVFDETSKTVQSFYTQNPYPKWKSLVFTPVPLERFFEMNGLKANAKIKVLIAGCGTGKQAVEMALANQLAQITAIDLSPTSLAYARLMAKHYEVSNIDFQLLDILDVATLNHQFDYIMSTGVIHHMNSPQDGLNALSGVLNPNGLMLLGFYSAAARVDLPTYQQEVKATLLADETLTPKTLSRWRSQLNDDDFKRKWFNSHDFFSLNGMMDALFHPQQSEYTLMEIQELLDNTGLQFGQMAVSNQCKAIYKQALEDFPVMGNHEELSKWHIFELSNPHFFDAMYNFFVTSGTGKPKQAAPQPDLSDILNRLKNKIS